jgi:hypothetical protein
MARAMAELVRRTASWWTMARYPSIQRNYVLKAASSRMWTSLAALLALPAVFFSYYTVRLIYVNIAVEGVARHRQSGMYIGFVVFPAAVIVFGWLSLKCWRHS